MTSVEEPARPGERTRDAARTRAEILDVATREFARAGYDGPIIVEVEDPSAVEPGEPYLIAVDDLEPDDDLEFDQDLDEAA